MDIAQAIASLQEFDTIIDVRSPDEWHADHLPGAINAPVLSNEERAAIGTLYQQSPFEAKKHGAALVARNIAHALESQFADKPRNWKPLIYCWRGGNRSNAMGTIMQRIGWKANVLTGGYTAYRRFVIDDLQHLVNQFRYTVVCGVTGSGKSLYLRQRLAAGDQVLDLEALAHHRGSLLGSEPAGEQPSQKYFETLLWNALRSFDSNREVLLESESKKIGALQVPQALMDRMRQSDCIELIASDDERIRYLCHDYAHFFSEPQQLKAQLDRLVGLVGKERLNAWHALIDAARWPELVGSLLAHHYDPTYRRSMQKNYARYANAQRIVGHPAQQTAFT